MQSIASLEILVPLNFFTGSVAEPASERLTVDHPSKGFSKYSQFGLDSNRDQPLCRY